MYETQLADEDNAITAYESVLAIDPDAHGGIAARALERLYEQQKRWADLARLLERRALQSPPADGDRAAAAAGRDPGRVARRARRGSGGAGAAVGRADAVEIADRGLLDQLERIYRRAERHDDFLRTLQRQADAAANPAERLAILRRLAAEGEARPEGQDRAAEALEQILRLEPARRRGVRCARAHLPRRGSAGRAGRCDGAAAGGHRDRSRRSASCCRRWPRSTSASSTSGSRRSTPTAGAEAAGDSAAARRTPRSTGWRERLGRWDAATEAARKWARARARGSGGARGRSRACGATTASSRRRWACSSTPAERENDARGAGGAADRGGADRSGRPGEGDVARARRTRPSSSTCGRWPPMPDHAPAAERLAEIYATRGRWADVEELLDIVIDGLEPGETDRLVALEMKLAEACVQLGKTDKNKMDKALDCAGARPRGPRRVAAGAAQVRRPAHAARASGRTR